MAADLTTREGCDRLIEAVQNAGGVDLLVNVLGGSATRRAGSR